MAANEKSEGRKDDAGKLRFDLIPPGPLMKLAEVYTIGAKKYSDRNWEKGLIWGRTFAALMRHAWRWWNGEKFDPADGQHHLASVAWNAFALMEYEETHPELDDRPYTAVSRNPNPTLDAKTRPEQPQSNPGLPTGAHAVVCQEGSAEEPNGHGWGV